MSDEEHDHHTDRDSAGGMSPGAVNRAWESVLDRGRDVLPLFAECELGLTITVASHALGLRDKAELQHLLVKTPPSPIHDVQKLVLYRAIGRPIFVSRRQAGRLGAASRTVNVNLLRSRKAINGANMDRRERARTRPGAGDGIADVGVVPVK